MENNCKFNEIVYMYFDEELDSKVTEELFEHLKVCDRCLQKYRVLDSLKKELKNMSEVELPIGYKEKLHQQLVETSKRFEIVKSENKFKILNRFIIAVAAVIILTVVIQGYYLFSQMFSDNVNLSKTSENSLDSLAKANINASKDMDYSSDSKRSENKNKIEEDKYGYSKPNNSVNAGISQGCDPKLFKSEESQVERRDRTADKPISEDRMEINQIASSKSNNLEGEKVPALQDKIDKTEGKKEQTSKAIQPETNELEVGICAENGININKNKGLLGNNFIAGGRNEGSREKEISEVPEKDSKKVINEVNKIWGIIRRIVLGF